MNKKKRQKGREKHVREKGEREEKKVVEASKGKKLKRDIENFFLFNDARRFFKMLPACFLLYKIHILFPFNQRRQRRR
jgi:hypothetical protein